jgi:hypothetical protein
MYQMIFFRVIGESPKKGVRNSCFLSPDHLEEEKAEGRRPLNYNFDLLMDEIDLLVK